MSSLFPVLSPHCFVLISPYLLLRPETQISVCVCEISVRSRGKGVKSGFRTRGLMITWAWLVRFIARDLGTLVKRNETQLCDFITTEPARLAGIAVIPGGNFPSNHTCRAAR